MQELILFSRADLERSIPSMVDGLKPGQRKILFCCFKRNIRKDVKAGPSLLRWTGVYPAICNSGPIMQSLSDACMHAPTFSVTGGDIGLRCVLQLVHVWSPSTLQCWCVAMEG